MSDRIAHYAVLAGMCALVPVPLLDAWLERRALRALYGAVGEHAGRPIDPAALELLVEDRSSLLLGCLGAIFFWPIKKLFRTLLYFLTVKDVLDGVAAASLRAAMLHAAIEHLPHGAGRVRSAMDETLRRWQYSPVSRVVLRGERPEASWIVADPIGVRVLYRHAGGGKILEDFRARLEAPR